jgi:hypothetical protein
MLATKVVCPNCSRLLKTTTALPVGKKVLCRQCGTTFGVQPDDGPPTPAPARRLPTPPAAVPVAEAAPGGANKALLFGGVIGAALLLMLVGSAAVVAFAVLRPNKVAQVSDTKPAADPDKPPEYCPPVPIKDDKPDPVVTVETPTEKPWLPKEEQEKVDKALERGLDYLRKQQGPQGFWPGGAQNAGMAALPALTLLECGAKADDPQVLKAAEYVRNNAKDLKETYSLALCILFLDRLGVEKDNPLIQTLALRLIAGQTHTGGWSYNCPTLVEKDERDLMQLLQERRPARAPEAITGRPGDPAGRVGTPDEITTRPGEKGPDRVAPGDNRSQPNPAPPPGNLKGDPAPDPKRGNSSDDRTKPGAPAPNVSFEQASPVVKNVPALQPVDDAARKRLRQDGTDNSNTQFAILAIWVAGRHDVPTERVCELIDLRFRTSQCQNGAWSYNYANNSQAAANGTPAMTCAGLLGLAVGHGVAAPAPGEKTVPKEGLDDKQIKKAFEHLSTHLGKSQVVEGKPRGKAPPQAVGLYFLWSVERVGVMYNLRTIADKDWYAWGSEILVDHQKPDGSWGMGNYHGASPQLDTSFALLFLKRANLAQDLSKKIEYLIDIKGVGNRN